MDGQISTFRIWSVKTDGKDVCASAPLPGLELGLILSDTGSTVHDVSGNERNGNVHDADWSEDVPPFDGSLCPTYYLLQSQKSDADSDGGGGGTFVLLVVVIALAAGGMYMAFDKGLLKAKGTVAQSMYAQMEEDATAKDKRIAELEKQLEMGGASSPCLLSQACAVRLLTSFGGCRSECGRVRGANPRGANGGWGRGANAGDKREPGGRADRRFLATLRGSACGEAYQYQYSRRPVFVTCVRVFCIGQLRVHRAPLRPAARLDPALLREAGPAVSPVLAALRTWPPSFLDPTPSFRDPSACVPADLPPNGQPRQVGCGHGRPNEAM